MTPENRRKLIQNRVQLAQEINPLEVITYLCEKEVLTSHMYEEIQTCKTRYEQATHLLDLLPRRGDRAFTIFCDALRTANQTWLADLLEN